MQEREFPWGKENTRRSSDQLLVLNPLSGS
jgi:hypothetical protein